MNPHGALTLRFRGILTIWVLLSSCLGCGTGPVDHGAPPRPTTSPESGAPKVPEWVVETGGDAEFWDRIESKDDLLDPGLMKTAGRRGGVVSRWAKARSGEAQEPEPPPPINIEKLRGDPSPDGDPRTRAQPESASESSDGAPETEDAPEDASSQPSDELDGFDELLRDSEDNGGK